MKKYNTFDDILEIYNKLCVFLKEENDDPRKTACAMTLLLGRIIRTIGQDPAAAIKAFTCAVNPRNEEEQNDIRFN